MAIWHHNDITRKLNEKIEQRKQQPLEVALVGETATGKTSFINAVRGLEYDDPGFIDVMEVTERYQSYVINPEEPTVRFWDFLGSADADLEKYDLFFIFGCGRFSEANVKAAKNIHASGKAFYYIRTMIDQDMENGKRSHPKSHDDDTMMQRIRKDCRDNFQRCDIRDAEVFLVSNFEPTRYDFPELKRKLMGNVTTYKIQSIVTSLGRFCEDEVNVKVASILENISSVAWHSTLWCWVPIPSWFLNTTENLIGSEIDRSKERLGIDDYSIDIILRWAGIPVSSLEKATRDSPSLGDQSRWIHEMIYKESKLPYMEWLRFLPILGTIPSCMYAYFEVISLLSDAVGMLKKDAISVLKSAVDGHVNQKFVEK